MPIEIQQPGLAELYLTAAELSRRKAESRIAQQQQQEQGRIETLQIQQEHQRNMKLLDSTLDLEMHERSKRWEIDKMEISSRIDFEREEKERAKKLDDINNALRQIDKEVESGRITEEQAQPIRFSYEMRRYGAAPPVSLIKPPKEEEADVPTPSQQLSAYKALQTEELRKPTWLEKWLPGGKGELTEEERIYRETFERIAKGLPATSPAAVIDETNIEPTSVKEFEDTVARLKAVDTTKALAYYNKWQGKF